MRVTTVEKQWTSKYAYKLFIIYVYCIKMNEFLVVGRANEKEIL